MQKGEKRHRAISAPIRYIYIYSTLYNTKQYVYIYVYICIYITECGLPMPSPQGNPCPHLWLLARLPKSMDQLDFFNLWEQCKSKPPATGETIQVKFILSSGKTCKTHQENIKKHDVPPFSTHIFPSNP